MWGCDAARWSGAPVRNQQLDAEGSWERDAPSELPLKRGMTALARERAVRLTGRYS